MEEPRSRSTTFYKNYYLPTFEKPAVSYIATGAQTSSSPSPKGSTPLEVCFPQTLEDPTLPVDGFGTTQYQFSRGDAFGVFQLQRGSPIGSGRFTNNIHIGYDVWDYPKKKVVKLIDHETDPDVAKQLFTQEVCTLSKLKHKNIVNMLSFTYTPQHYGILLEFVDAGRLYDLLKNLTMSHIEHYFIQMTVGLTYMHKKRVVHRDLKLEDILITSNGVLKIADFDVSGTLKACQTLVFGQVGTDIYRSPEINVEPAQWYDAFKADAYALGVCLWSMLYREKLTYPRAYTGIMYETIFPVSHHKYLTILHNLLWDDPIERMSAIKLSRHLEQNPDFSSIFHYYK